MNRFALFSCLMMLAVSFMGCGLSDVPPPADKSNMPPEVKAEEDKIDANIAKRAAEIQKKSSKSTSR